MLDGKEGVGVEEEEEEEDETGTTANNSVLAGVSDVLLVCGGGKVDGGTWSSGDGVM